MFYLIIYTKLNFRSLLILKTIEIKNHIRLNNHDLLDFLS